jgi:hypothetical protein
MLLVVLVVVLLALAALATSRFRIEAGRRERRETFAQSGELVARVAGYDDNGEALLVCKPGATLRTTAGGVRACCAARPTAAAPKCGACEFLNDAGEMEVFASAECGSK